MRIIQFEQQHAEQIRGVEAEAYFGGTYPPGVLDLYAGSPHAWTALDDDGAPIAAGGVVPLDAQEGEAWAIVGIQARPRIVALVRAMRRALDASGVHRIVAVVKRDFRSANHLLRLLGFDLVVDSFGEMDCSLYTRERSL